MKIGILTYHRSQNFGALLQAIALRQFLTNQGHEVYFIDYWPDYHKNLYRPINWDLLKMPEGLRSLYYFVRHLKQYSSRKRRADIFNAFISKQILNHIRPYSKEEIFDCIIYGSDQIWRKQSGMGNKFNPIYFGENILTAERSISYAASMGLIHSGDDDKKFLKESLSKLNKVMVRETSLKDLLQESGIDSSVVLDPTLLLTDDDWIDAFGLRPDRQEDYLLFYDLQMGNIDFAVVKQFAKERNLKIKVLTGEPCHKKEAGIEYLEYADPENFVDLFYNAKYVLTSSYHGLAFSLLFKKEFYTIFKYNPGRAESLLTKLDLRERMLAPNIEKIPDMLPIDYKEVDLKLDIERARSAEMLSEALTKHS